MATAIGSGSRPDRLKDPGKLANYRYRSAMLPGTEHSFSQFSREIEF
jgi:hypothetical protein